MGQGITASATVLQQGLVTQARASWHVFEFPSLLFLPLPSVGDSCEGINVLVSAHSSAWMEMPLLCM